MIIEHDLALVYKRSLTSSDQAIEAVTDVIDVGADITRYRQPVMVKISLSERSKTAKQRALPGRRPGAD